MGTTDHGLVYPDSNAPPQVWADIQELAESAEAALDAYEAWTSWTPVFNAGPTTLGSGGVSEGFYQQIGKLVHAEFRTELGTGFAFTGTTFELVLPLPGYAFGGVGLQNSLGSWIVRDDSVPAHYAGTIGVWDGGTVLKCSFGGSWTGSAPSSRVSSTNPITWAAGDILSGVLNYRAA